MAVCTYEWLDFVRRFVLAFSSGDGNLRVMDITMAQLKTLLGELARYRRGVAKIAGGGPAYVATSVCMHDCLVALGRRKSHVPGERTAARARCATWWVARHGDAS